MNPTAALAIGQSNWLDSDSLPVALVQVDANHIIESANVLACALFAPVDPVGVGLRTLFGLTGITGGGDLSGLVSRDDDSQPVLIGASDGRTFECRVGQRPQGGAVLVFVEVSQHIQATEQASRDPLTGLDNRRTLQSRLSQVLAERERSGAQVAVLCIDLDRFKSVNDTLGHPIGDLLLGKVAERLRSICRDDDIIARIGGDEFAIVQASTEQPEGAQALASRLVDLVGRTYVLGGHMANIGASVGVALAPSDGDDAGTLLKRADLALYGAKAEGRGRFRFFEGEMDARMQERRHLEIELRRALALRQFELAFQPQVQLATNKVSGFEALLRWRSPDRGLVSPAEFIPLAEEIGLIVQIGEWVLRVACQEAVGWPADVSIAVNLSPVQFRNGNLVQTVLSALSSSGLDPRRLELEITEGALLEDTGPVLEALRALRSLGVRISMDDFGTGYSSLSYLRKFPFDKIKIDQSFVRGMAESEDSRAIVRAVARLGSSLGMKTTAEGVETEEQLASIRAEGCHEVQGYLTGRPLTAAAAAALLDLPPVERSA